MKIEFLSQFTLAELLKIRDCLCRYAPTRNDEIDTYIGTEMDLTTTHERTDRCVNLIDMIIVSRAIQGKLVEI